jgi:hypothetical protein
VNEVCRPALLLAVQIRERDSLRKEATTMFQTSAGFLAGLVATLSLGALHLESDHQAASHDATSAVYRAVKSDRGIVRSPRAVGRTISIRTESLPRTSIVFRIPRSSGQEVTDHITKRDSHHAPAMRVKRTIACEPVVSTLTDVAKQLQPGRCVT